MAAAANPVKLLESQYISAHQALEKSVGPEYRDLRRIIRDAYVNAGLTSNDARIQQFLNTPMTASEKESYVRRFKEWDDKVSNKENPLRPTAKTPEALMGEFTQQLQKWEKQHAPASTATQNVAANGSNAVFAMLEKFRPANLQTISSPQVLKHIELSDALKKIVLPSIRLAKGKTLYEQADRAVQALGIQYPELKNRIRDEWSFKAYKA